MEKQNRIKYYCSECDREVNAIDLMCPHCGADVEEIDIEKEIEEAPSRFKGMIIFGNIIAAFGWLSLAGVIVSSYTILKSDLDVEKIISFFIFPITIISMFSFFLIAAGQFLKCHVAIERNGRQNNILLSKLIEQRKEN